MYRTHKICKRCNTPYPTTQYVQNLQNKDGLGSYCKECRKEYAKEFRARNAERNSEYMREYYSTHPEQKQAHKAHLKVSSAIRTGNLSRPDSIICPLCGNPATGRQIHAHHYIGHDHALDIQYICATCNHDITHIVHDAILDAMQDVA